MTKSKRRISLLCAIIVTFSSLAIPASAANTSDSDWYYYWEANRELISYPRLKADNSSTYFTPTESLPIGGVDFRTKLYVGENLDFVRNSSVYKTVTNRGKYTIAHSGTSKGYEAAIQARYPRDRYSWGSLTIKWSPDYVNESGVIQIN